MKLQEAVRSENWELNLDPPQERHVRFIIVLSLQSPNILVQSPHCSNEVTITSSCTVVLPLTEICVSLTLNLHYGLSLSWTSCFLLVTLSHFNKMARAPSWAQDQQLAPRRTCLTFCPFSPEDESVQWEWGMITRENGIPPEGARVGLQDCIAGRRQRSISSAPKLWTVPRTQNHVGNIYFPSHPSTLGSLLDINAPKNYFKYYMFPPPTV